MMTGVPSIPNQQQFLTGKTGFDPEAASLDTIPAAMEKGDVVLPASIANMNPQLKAAIAQAIFAEGGDPNRYIAGSPYGNWNPYSGSQHFGFFSKVWKKAKKAVKKIANDPILRTVALSVIAPGVGTALGSSLGVTSAAGTAALGYGATSAGLTLAGGGDLKDAAVSGLTSAGGAYLGSMASTANATDAMAGDPLGAGATGGDASMFSGQTSALNSQGLTSGGLDSWSLTSTPEGFGSSLIQGAKDATQSVLTSLPDSVGNYLGNIDLTTAQYAGYGDTAGTVVNAVRNMPEYLDEGNIANFQNYQTQQLPQAQAMNYLPANQAVNAVTSNNSPYTGVANILQNPMGANTKSLADVGVSYMSKMKNRDTGEDEYGDFGSNIMGKSRRAGFGGAMLIL